MSGEHFRAEIAAGFTCHRALHALHDRTHRPVVRREVFGAVLNGYACPDAAEFVVGPFVGLLESAPAAHVINEDGAKTRLPTFDDSQQVLQRVSAVDAHAALPGVDERAHNFDTASIGEALNSVVLVLGGVLLVVG